MTAPTRMTPLARYLDSVCNGHGGLAAFIAVRRIPGHGWQTFDDIAAELTTMSGDPVNRVSVRTFASRFGIPDTRYVSGRKMPGKVEQADVDAYLDALPGGLRDSVDHVVRGENVTVEAAETAAILVDADTTTAVLNPDADTTPAAGPLCPCGDVPATVTHDCTAKD